MSLVLHGIKACDTMKKARAWLDAHGLVYRFHDYKVEGAAPGMLQAWVDAVGWERLLNRSGTTFRALPDEAKADLDAAKAIGLMSAHPSMIKRPVLTGAGPLLVGFAAEAWAARLRG